MLFEFTCGGQQGIVVSRTEFFLDARHVGYFVKADICTEVYTETTLAFTAFRGNHHNTVGCFRSVQGRCGGTFQDRDAFDIFRVDVHHTVGFYTLVSPVTVFVGVAVMDGHTVHYDQRLCRTGDRRQTTYGDGYGGSTTTRSCLDAHT